MGRVVKFRLRSGHVKAGIYMHEENNVVFVLLFPNRSEIWAVPKGFLLLPKDKEKNVQPKPDAPKPDAPKPDVPKT